MAVYDANAVAPLPVDQAPKGKKVKHRFAVSRNVNPTCALPDKSTGYVHGEDGNSVYVDVYKIECIDCKGSGVLKLFTSEERCDRCLGCGNYYESYYDE